MTDTWECEVCDEDNSVDWGHCKHCNRPRGTWICRWCGRKASESTKACRACGQKKGTVPPEPPPKT